MILCGFPCCGKTTFGKRCAERLSLSFYDTDQLIGGRGDIIWKRVGEARFREIEVKAISFLESKPSIVATGGGTVLYGPSRKRLAALGKLIYLKASFSVLFKRIEKRGFLVFVNRDNPYQHLKEIAQMRFPLYERYCDEIIDTDSLTEKEIVATICNIYGR